MELEIQNEELRQAQVELANARDRYVDLYEFAPVGYATLDQQGRIQSANLTTAVLLAVERSQLIGKRLEEHVAQESRDACYVSPAPGSRNDRSPNSRAAPQPP